MARYRARGLILTGLFFGLAILYFAWIHRNKTAQAAAHQPPNGSIVFVGGDHQIRQCHGDCSDAECVTCALPTLEAKASPLRLVRFSPAASGGGAVAYNWPTFSPDGQKLAFVAAHIREQGPDFTVQIYDLKTHSSFVLLDAHALQPIYLYWLPDGRTLSFLQRDPQGFSLMLSDVREGATVKSLITGLPLYFDWSRKGDQLLFHSAGVEDNSTEQISLLTVGGHRQGSIKVLSSGKAPFKVPAWSKDGSTLAYVAVDGAKSKLILANGDGSNPRPFAELPDGEASMVWAPDGKYLAYGGALMPGSMTFAGLGLLDTARDRTIRLTDEDVAAFYFSPNSRWLAYVTMPQDKSYCVLNLINLWDGTHHEICKFITTIDTMMTYRYFDQYALSHSIWSPDSSALLVVGSIVKADLEDPSGLAPAPWVYRVDAENGTIKPIQRGTLAFWSRAG